MRAALMALSLLGLIQSARTIKCYNGEESYTVKKSPYSAQRTEYAVSKLTCPSSSEYCVWQEYAYENGASDVSTIERSCSDKTNDLNCANGEGCQPLSFNSRGRPTRICCCKGDYCNSAVSNSLVSLVLMTVFYHFTQ